MDSLTERKHKAIVTFFNEQYNVKRKRLDDALKDTATNFFLRERYVYKLIFYNKDNFDFYSQIADNVAKKELQKAS